MHGNLDDEEKEAVSKLLWTRLREAQTQVSTKFMSMEERLAKRCKINPEHTYVNFDFVLGSETEAERIWNIFKKVLTSQRPQRESHIRKACFVHHRGIGEG